MAFLLLHISARHWRREQGMSGHSNEAISMIGNKNVISAT
jgi:hypothetical protein